MRLILVPLIVWLTLGPSPQVLVCAEPESLSPGVVTEELILGYTLREWRERMKGLDPAGPEAPQQVPALIQLMQHESVPIFTRKQAALTLGRIGAPAVDAVPVLRATLQESDSTTTRLWVLKSLTLMGPPAAPAAPDVAELVRDPRQLHLIRSAGLEALGRMGPQHAHVMQTLLTGARGDLPCHSEQGQQELRMASIDVLGLLGPGAAPAIPALIRAAEADWDLLRLSAVTTLGRIGPQAEIAIPTLVDVIGWDDAPEVRDAAATALASMGTLALPPFRQLVQDDDPQIRERVLIGGVALGVQGRELLGELLEDADLDLRIRAASALMRDAAQAELAAQVLLRSLPAASARTQRTAYMALRDHPGTWSPDDDAFRTLLSHDDARIRELAKRLERERAGQQMEPPM
ncbi:MAG: HEAT repeat domain-containing protein [Planctomycetaceae bacterium]|nr:HEAT repeat domain-containing protein [Planctomycetaceae bacterium]